MEDLEEEEDEEEEDFLSECLSFCFFDPLLTYFLLTSGETVEEPLPFFLPDSTKQYHKKHVKTQKVLTTTNIIHIYLMRLTRLHEGGGVWLPWL